MSIQNRLSLREGLQAWPFTVDVSDTASVTNLMNGIRKEFGRLDVLVNFAGVGWRTPIEKITVDEFQKIININLTGSFLITQQALSFIRNSVTGRSSDGKTVEPDTWEGQIVEGGQRGD